MMHDALAVRYAEGVRRRHPISRIVPWALLVQIALLIIRYLLLDARSGKIPLDVVVGQPMASGGAGFDTHDIPNEIVADWRRLPR